MLGKRYEYDGKPVWNLNELQIEMKKQIELKINQGIYQFESVSCCICNSNEFETLSTKERYGLYMPVVICKQCGLIQTNPRMNQNSYNSFYNNEYRKLYTGTEFPSNESFLNEYNKGKQIYSYLSNVLPKTPNELFIFEVGCGAGGVLQYFREQGCCVQGIDLGKEYIDFGKTRYGLNLSVGAIRDVPFDKSLDVIIYSDVLEHILHPERELADIRRILSPNGILYIGVPGVKNLMNSYGRNFLNLLQNAHTYHFTLRTMKNLLKTTGFQLIIGDEFIRAVFKKSPLTSSETVKNDYETVMTYLKKLERKWLSKLFIKKALKVFGMYGIVKKTYYKVKEREITGNEI